ncbi:hypothetical protein COP2_010803 [Malus domestica]
MAAEQMQRVASPPPQSVESHFYIVFNMLAGDEHRGLRDQTTKLLYLAQNQENEEAIFQLVNFGLCMCYFSVSPAISPPVAFADGGDEHRGLIAYAWFLIYTLFSLLVIF